MVAQPEVKKERRIQWAVGFHSKGVSAETIAAHLEKLAKSQGIGEFQELSADILLDDALQPDSPLHPFVEHDREVTWRKHNLSIMRSVARSLVFVEFAVEAPRKVTQLGRVHSRLRVPHSNKSRYIHQNQVDENPVIARQILEGILQELKAFARKYRAFKRMTATLNLMGKAILELEKEIKTLIVSK